MSHFWLRIQQSVILSDLTSYDLLNNRHPLQRETSLRKAGTTTDLGVPLLPSQALSTRWSSHAEQINRATNAVALTQ